MKTATLALLTLIAAAPCFAETAQAPQPMDQKAHAGHMGHAAPAACAEAKPDCAATATPAFAPDGRLWIAYSVGNRVYASASRDKGKSFDAPVTVASVESGVIDANGEARPKILALRGKGLLASYTVRPEKTYNGTVYVARSGDGGKSFSAPQALIAATAQRFETFIVNPKGRIYGAWLDKSDAEKAKAAGQPFEGSGVAVGWSDDGGATFNGKSILMDHSCECCRIAAALDRDGLPVFAWRQVFDGNLRDHYAAKLSADGAALKGGRVSEDQWATTCPHHGPSLAIDAKGVWRIVWFAKGKARQGLFYAMSADGGKSFSAPEKFGDDAHAPSHAVVLAAKGWLHRAWKEFDGETTSIALQSSHDGGKSWSAPHVAATTTDASDHPLLIEHKGVAYLSWLTHKEGYRLAPIAPEQAATQRASAAAVNSK